PQPAIRRSARQPVDPKRRDLADPVGHLHPPLRPGRLADPPLAAAPDAASPEGAGVVSRRIKLRSPRRGVTGRGRETGIVIPPDPRQLTGPLDPSLASLPGSLAPHRRA